jgi:hypothetical protein
MKFARLAELALAALVGAEHRLGIFDANAESAAELHRDAGGEVVGLKTGPVTLQLEKVASVAELGAAKSGNYGDSLHCHHNSNTARPTFRSRPVLALWLLSR